MRKTILRNNTTEKDGIITLKQETTKISIYKDEKNSMITTEEVKMSLKELKKIVSLYTMKNETKNQFKIEVVEDGSQFDDIFETREEAEKYMEMQTKEDAEITGKEEDKNYYRVVEVVKEDSTCKRTFNKEK